MVSLNQSTGGVSNKRGAECEARYRTVGAGFIGRGQRWTWSRGGRSLAAILTQDRANCLRLLKKRGADGKGWVRVWLEVHEPGTR